MSSLVIIFLVLAICGLCFATWRARVRLAELVSDRDNLSVEAERTRRLVENSPYGILELDLESGRILSANGDIGGVLGRPVTELVGRRLVDVSPVLQSDGRASCEAADSFVRAAQSGQKPKFEWAVAEMDGTDRAVLVRLVPIPGEDRGLAFVADVSQDADVGQSLRERARFRTLVDYATEAIVLLDVEAMSFSEVNTNAADLFGYSRDELLSLRPIDIFASTQPDGRPATVVIAEAVEQVLASGGLVETEALARRAGGDSFNVRIRSIALPGNKPQVRSTIIDVTDNIRKEEILRVAKEEAEKASRTKTVFLAHMSHEIRTPMNGVLGMLELLMDSELSRDQRQSAELARSSAESLLAILNDVLDISKIEAGQLDLECIPFELHKMVNSIVGVVAPRASQNGVEIYCEIQPGVPERVTGDPVRLRQVLSNLVSNAVKFTRDGEVLVRLSLEGRTDAAVGIGFSVLDTGAGIAEERLASIFDPFVQADESISRRFGGTGLGLTICRQLVGLMGGTLEVASELAKGSEFRFSLALDRAAGDPPDPVRGVDLDGARVLLVDDNSTSRRIMAETLESGCARVLAAGDLYSALRSARIAVAEDDPFVLAIVDASMPERGALEFAQSVKEDRNLSDLKMIMLTPADRLTDAGELEAAAITTWLSKPVPQADLIECAKAVLSGVGEPGQARGYPLSGAASRGLTILLAEDNSVNQRVATGMLKKRGHEVDVVDNGLAACQAALSRSYDVVLMDIQMPELDGIGATERIRQAGCDVRIIALTAHATSDDRQRCLAAGMNDFLTKPFQPNEFFTAVEGGPESPTRRPERLDLGVAPDFGVAEPAEVAGLGDAEVEAHRADDRPGRLDSAVGEPVDVAGFRATMEEAGVGDIVEETLHSYLEESAERISWLEDAMTSGDTEGVGKAAHALKSSSSAIGAKGLARLLENAEKAAKAGDLEGSRSRRKEILALYSSVVDQLERVLAVSQ